MVVFLPISALIYLLFEIKKTIPGPWISGLNQQIGSSAHLLTSKTRVTPPAGLTAPRSEINSLMLRIRLASVALSSLTMKPSRLTIMGGNQCTVSAVESNSATLAAYMSNRVSEYDNTIKAWSLSYPSMSVDPLFYTPDYLNLADVATRGKVTNAEINTNSLWQLGPD